MFFLEENWRNLSELEDIFNLCRVLFWQNRLTKSSQQPAVSNQLLSLTNRKIIVAKRGIYIIMLQHLNVKRCEFKTRKGYLLAFIFCQLKNNRDQSVMCNWWERNKITNLHKERKCVTRPGIFEFGGHYR